MAYQLEERTLKFGQDVVVLCGRLVKNLVNRPLISQFVRSGASVGANYREASGASSKKDFRNKIYIAKKEALETQYWLDILLTVNPSNEEEIKKLKQEVVEIGKILSKIIGTLNKSG